MQWQFSESIQRQISDSIPWLKSVTIQWLSSVFLKARPLKFCRQMTGFRNETRFCPLNPGVWGYFYSRWFWRTWRFILQRTRQTFKPPTEAAKLVQITHLQRGSSLSLLSAELAIPDFRKWRITGRGVSQYFSSCLLSDLWCELEQGGPSNPSTIRLVVYQPIGSIQFLSGNNDVSNSDRVLDSLISIYWYLSILIFWTGPQDFSFAV